jgi:hypothetical protein
MRPVPLPGIGSSVIRSKRAQGPSRSATNSPGPTGQGYRPPSPFPIYSLASSSKQNTANASPRPGTLTVSGFERASGLRHATQNPGSLLIAVTFSFRRYPPRTIALEDRTPIIDAATTPVDTSFGPISTLRLRLRLSARSRWSLVSTFRPSASLVSNASASPRFQPVVSVRNGWLGIGPSLRSGSLERQG